MRAEHSMTRRVIVVPPHVSLRDAWDIMGFFKIRLCRLGTDRPNIGPGQLGSAPELGQESVYDLEYAHR